MTLLIVIFLVAFVLIPLLQLILKDPPLLFCKIIVYVVTFIYVIWALWGAGFSHPRAF